MKISFQKIDYKLAYIAVALFIIWPPASLIAMFCLFIMQLNKYKINLFKSVYFYLVLALTAYIIIKLSVLNQFISNLKYPIKLSVLMIVFLSFITFKHLIKENLNRLFVVMMSAIQIYSFLHIIHFFYKTKQEFHGLNNFAYINEAIGFERPYIGFLSAISILLLLFHKHINLKKYLKILFISLSFIYILLIAAKLAVGLTITLLVIYLVLNREWKLISGFVFFITLISYFVPNSLTIVDRFSKLSKDERIFLWQNSTEIIKSDKDFSILFGHSKQGFEKIHDQLQEININNSFDAEIKRYYKKRKKNMHNQYLEMYIFGGLVGVLLLLLPFIYVIYLSFQSQNYLLFLLTFCVLLFMFVENVLERQIGVFLIALLLAINHNKLKNSALPIDSAK